MTLLRRLERIEAACNAEDDVTLEEYVLWALRVGQPLGDADQRHYNDFIRRAELSQLTKLIRDAAEAGDAYRASTDLHRGRNQFSIESRSGPGRPSAWTIEMDDAPTPTTEINPPTSPAVRPEPQIETSGNDAFYRRGWVYGSGGDDRNDVIPAQPGLNLDALIVGARGRSSQ
jgi:hypothetical protein